MSDFLNSYLTLANWIIKQWSTARRNAQNGGVAGKSGPSIAGAQPALPITTERTPATGQGNPGDQSKGFGDVNSGNTRSQDEIAIRLLNAIADAIKISVSDGFRQPGTISPSGPSVQAASSSGNRPNASIDAPKMASAMPGAQPPSRVTLEMVTVGNPGNSSDARTGFGRVNYDYNISKYEVTIQQYTTFLNAVAASDPYGLYNPSMATDQTIAGIARSGTSGSYTYSVISPSGVLTAGSSSPGNRPIAYIDWFDAARFANWMHNGQGKADTETGAYTLRGATSGPTVSANRGARFTIPTQDEWYKAAYYSPLLNQGRGGYYVFASQSNATPGSIPDNIASNGARPNQANYYDGTFSVTQQQLLSAQNNQNYLTNVGAFINSSSYYGTFDQGGNVYEWIDTPENRQQGRLRGGFWMSNKADLSYVDYYNTSPSYSFDGSGFRLASPGRDSSGIYGQDPSIDAAWPPAEPLPYSDNNRTILLGGMAMVTVGDPGNTKDARTGSGSIDYIYSIGKYEVTIQQYTDFLNAVASSDPYQLYNTNMATDLNVAGIARSGSSGSYRYSVIGPSGVNPDGARSPGNRPIAYVSWFDAARYANWMHNGRGAGDTETGAYTLKGAIAGLAVPLNAGARFNIPTADEWYKAAYYSQNLNDGKGGYYVFPTQHDATPGSVPGNNINARHTPNQANYFNAGFSVTQSMTPSATQNYLTDVGAFSKSASYYGTFDQAGNVYEWTDNPGSGSQRSLRGGYLVSNVADTSYLDDYILPPDYESSGSGFRLASRQQTTANQYFSSNPMIDSLIGQLLTGNNTSFSNDDSITQFMLSNQPSSTAAAASSRATTLSGLSGGMSIADASQLARLLDANSAAVISSLNNKDFSDVFAGDLSMITSLMNSIKPL